MKTKSKLRRMSKILSMAFVIFIQIYWYKVRKKSESDWNSLWGNIGERFRQTLFELEGLLIKIGQLLSIRSDLLPSAFISQLQDLTDQVPPSEWGEIKEVLELEWGCSLEEKLLSIEPKAIASASIGEVYKGVLPNGKEVAIKVQRPGIQSIIHTDFQTLKIIIWFADHFVPMPKGFINLKVLYHELKQVIERELDFVHEKETLLSFQQRFHSMDIVKVPEAYEEFCTSKVLVMEWVEGIKLTDEEKISSLEVSRQELAQRLIKLFLPQWLEPGTFHADPHSGNVLVSKKGEIILLDYGMTGEISKKDASYLQELIECFLSKNYSKAVETLTQLGFLLPEADPRTMERLLSELMTFQPEQLKEMDLIKLKLEMNDIIQALPIQVPTRFVFLGRSFVTMEGLIRGLVTEDELFELAKPVFMEWVKNQGNNKWTFVWYWLQSQPLFKVLHSATEFLQLPQKLEILKEKEQRREFQFTIYENYKRQLFQLMLLSLFGVGAGIYAEHLFILQLASAVAGVSSVGYLICNYKLKKWLKYMHEKRR
ncbi:AarF/ABC1/UbiB kinase family protein [Anaerobacillus alkaliphilus]|uniref:AarF/ABC1/UbiB kinase family protein n=1 Tax=Anaerobacillus alkaliphilus TaxID=1548597 RepID=A0A4Q0VMY6_9BACI|nr:AarF/UbiB family protein [Anaerobacillus alkaliphilus]RXI95568.1 AarF/ABC1/UbiB kinase family protein [Anaerobacillus alkaliphilus]